MPYIVILDLCFSYLYVVVGRCGGKSSSSLQGDAHPFQVFVECKRAREMGGDGVGRCYKVHVRAHPESFLLLLFLSFSLHRNSPCLRQLWEISKRANDSGLIDFLLLAAMDGKRGEPPPPFLIVVPIRSPL